MEIPKTKTELPEKELKRFGIKKENLEFTIKDTIFKTVRIDDFVLNLKDKNGIHPRASIANYDVFLKEYFEIVYGKNYIGHAVTLFKSNGYPIVEACTIEGRVIRYS